MAALIELYTKRTCPYSRAAKRLLSDRGAAFQDTDVTDDAQAFEEMTLRANGGATVPQIFIDGRHVGGYTELAKMEDRGELDRLLESSDAASP